MIVYSACFAVGTVPYTLLLVYIYIYIYSTLSRYYSTYIIEYNSQPHFTEEETVIYRSNHLLFQIISHLPLQIYFPFFSTCFLPQEADLCGQAFVWMQPMGEPSRRLRGREQSEVKFYFLLECCLTLATFLNKMLQILCMWPRLHSFLLPGSRNQFFPSSLRAQGQ